MNLRRLSLSALAATIVYIIVWIGRLPPAGLVMTSYGTGMVNEVEAIITEQSKVMAQEDGYTAGTDTIYTQRRRMNKVCGDFANRGTLSKLKLDGYVWHLESKNITYCVTPKVGSTFWKSVLRYLGHDHDGGNIKGLSDIGGLDVHYAPLKKIKQHNIRSPASRARISGTKTFTFSRDPYTRLWAAYIDKFTLPDFWGTNDSLKIIQHFRRNATAHAQRCANDISFEEFLQYVIDTGSRGLKMNEHWTPLYRLCNPCLMKFDAVGRYENYVTDTREIIKILGVQDDIGNLAGITETDREMKHITETIQYNFELEEYAVNGCFDKLMVAKRLWMVFQFKGYIPEEHSFPMETINEFKSTFETDPITVLTRIVRTTVGERINPVTNNPDKSAGGFDQIARNRVALVHMGVRKTKLMHGAYRAIPKDIIIKIRDIFLIDFQLFNYEANPDGIFRLK